MLQGILKSCTHYLLFVYFYSCHRTSIKSFWVNLCTSRWHHKVNIAHPPLSLRVFALSLSVCVCMCPCEFTPDSGK